jgi:F420-dependent methylenetetrahydromethanopterin dehydrogenase
MRTQRTQKLLRSKREEDYSSAEILALIEQTEFARDLLQRIDTTGLSSVQYAKDDAIQKITHLIEVELPRILGKATIREHRREEA